MQFEQFESENGKNVINIIIEKNDDIKSILKNKDTEIIIEKK